MSSIALMEAKQWADDLLDAECQGRKDKEKRIRFSLARKLGIPESYLFRLQYKTNTMNDVRGSVYRALMIAHQAYQQACEANEAAAEADKAERLKLKAARHAADLERASARLGTVAAQDRAAEREEA